MGTDIGSNLEQIDSIGVAAASIDLVIEKMLVAESGCDRVGRAYSLAKQAHKGAQNVRGEPYIVVPAELALLLKSRGADLDTILAGLLYAVFSNTVKTLEDIRAVAGEKVTQIVFVYDQLISVSSPSVKTRKFDEWLSTPEVAELAFCARLLALREFHTFHPKKQQSLVNETKELYIPFARDRGQAELAKDLELFCLLHTHPEFHERRQQYTALRDKARRQLRGILIRDFPGFLRGVDELGRGARVHLQPTQAHLSRLSEKIEELQDALADNRAPSLKDLLGSVGPLDLKGVWTWSEYLLKHSRRAVVVRKALDSPSTLERPGMLQLDRKHGGVLDVLIAIGMRLGDHYSLDSIAKAIRAVLRRNKNE